MGFSREGIVSSCTSLLFFSIFVLTIFAPLVGASHNDAAVFDYIDNSDGTFFKYVPGARTATKITYKVGEFGSDVAQGFWDGFTGTVTGLWDLGKGTVTWTLDKASDPGKTWNEVKQGASDFASDPLGNTKKGIESVASLPGKVISGYVDYLSDCPEGHVGQCIGKGGFELATIAGPAAVAKLGKVEKIAKSLDAISDANKLEKTLKAVETTTDALKNINKVEKINQVSTIERLASKTNAFADDALEKLTQSQLTNRIIGYQEKTKSITSKIESLKESGVVGTEHWLKQLRSGNDPLSKRLTTGEMNNWLTGMEGQIKGIEGEMNYLKKYMSVYNVKELEVNIPKGRFGQQIDVAHYQNGKITEIIEVKNQQTLNPLDLNEQMKRYANAAETIGKQQGQVPKIILDLGDAPMPPESAKLIEELKAKGFKFQVNAKQPQLPLFNKPPSPTNTMAKIKETLTRTNVVQNSLIATIATVVTIVGQSQANEIKKSESKPTAIPLNGAKQANIGTTSQGGANSIIYSVTPPRSSMTTTPAFVLPKPASKVAVPSSNSQPQQSKPAFDLRSGSAYSVTQPSTSKVTATSSSPTPTPGSKSVTSSIASAVQKTLNIAAKVSPVANTISKAVSSITSFFTAPKAAPAPAVKSAPAPAPSRSAPSAPSRSSSSGGSRGGGGKRR